MTQTTSLALFGPIFIVTVFNRGCHRGCMAGLSCAVGGSAVGGRVVVVVHDRRPQAGPCTALSFLNMKVMVKERSFWASHTDVCPRIHGRRRSRGSK